MDDNNLIDKRDNALEEMANNEKLMEYIKEYHERIASKDYYKEYLKTITDDLHREILKETRKDILDKISKRQEYNYKCLDILKELIDKYPDWRFTQIIFNLGLAEDRFYQESVDTYELMKMAIKMCGI
jgi:predicted RND superfamily exporter protein